MTKSNDLKITNARPSAGFPIQRALTSFRLLKSRAFVMLLWTGFTATGLAAANAENDSKVRSPLNIVVLVADDQRFDSLGIAGNPNIHTPNLDELAASGIRFRRAYVTTSICMTSRASILTGQYMSRHKIDRFGKPLTAEQFQNSYPGVLRANGYHSGFVGKYGVGGLRADDFDFGVDYSGRHWMKIDGEEIHVTERNARDALRFLEQRPRDRPFQLSVSFFAPHAEDSAAQQYLPQAWSAEFYRDVQIPVSRRMGPEFREALPEFLRTEKNEVIVRFQWRFDTSEKYQQSMINYFRLITEVDEAVGRIMEKLREQQVLDQTLIVYLGDNGYFHADRGLADKWYPYEESIRVPLIVWDPRLPRDQRGLTIDQTALNIDIAPTVLQGAGLAIPPAMQGQDLSQLYLGRDLTEQRNNWRKEFFYEHPTISNRDRIPSSEAVVTPEFKYVFWPEWDYEQLFDLTDDPDELINRLTDPAYQQTRDALRQKMASWRQAVR